MRLDAFSTFLAIRHRCMAKERCLEAAKHVDLEVCGDRVKLQLRRSTPRTLTRPFRKAIERNFPTTEILQWDGDDEERQRGSQGPRQGLLAWGC